MPISIKPWVVACALTLVIATQADAMCKGKPQVTLSDGSVACVLEKQTTEITYSQSILGGGAATSRKSKHKGAAVVVKFVNKKDASSLSRKIIVSRAKELCKRYRGEFLAEIKKPANPFMVVIMTWGDKPSRFTITDQRLMVRTNTLWEAHLQKNCWNKSLR